MGQSDYPRRRRHAVADVREHEFGGDQMEVEPGQLRKNVVELEELGYRENFFRDSRRLSEKPEESGSRNVGFGAARGGERGEVPEIVVRHYAKGVGSENAFESYGSETAQYRVAPYDVGAEFGNRVPNFATARIIAESGQG